MLKDIVHWDQLKEFIEKFKVIIGVVAALAAATPVAYRFVSDSVEMYYNVKHLKEKFKHTTTKLEYAEMMMKILLIRESQLITDTDHYDQLIKSYDKVTTLTRDDAEVLFKFKMIQKQSKDELDNIRKQMIDLQRIITEEKKYIEDES